MNLELIVAECLRLGEVIVQAWRALVGSQCMCVHRMYMYVTYTVCTCMLCIYMYVCGSMYMYVCNRFTVEVYELC